MHVKSP